MLKTLLIIIAAFFVVRWISRLFLQSPKNKSGNARFFYQTFKNVRKQQKKQQEQQNRAQHGRAKNDLDDIEEAEYEDVTEEKKNDN